MSKLPNRLRSLLLTPILILSACAPAEALRDRFLGPSEATAPPPPEASIPPAERTRIALRAEARSYPPPAPRPTADPNPADHLWPPPEIAALPSADFPELTSVSDAASDAASDAEPSPAENPADFALAWVDSQGLWRLSTTEPEPQQIASGSGLRQPLISPDRRWILWQKVKPEHPEDPTFWELWIAAWQDGSGMRQLLTPADLPAARGWNGHPCPRWLRDIAWLPDASGLAFGSSAVGDCGAYPQKDFWTFELELKAPLRSLSEGVAHFRVSPDGKRVALIDPGDPWADAPLPGRVRVHELDGGAGLSLLDFAILSTESDYWAFPDLRWTAAGEALLLALEPPWMHDRRPADLDQLLRLGLDGSRVRLGESAFGAIEPRDATLFGLPTVHGLGTQVRRPRWSADLRQLARIDFMPPADADRPLQPGGMPVPSRHRQLWIADADGSGGAAYARFDDLVFHAWAPAGARFLYGDRNRLWLGERDAEPRLLYETKAEGEEIAEVRWAGTEHFSLLRTGMSIPPLLELHGLDGSSRGLAQDVGIAWDSLSAGP